METDVATLSALATSVHDLTQRVSGLADRLQGAPREDAAADLYDVERHLVAASRRLATLVQRLG